jgi:hypothetical protein
MYTKAQVICDSYRMPADDNGWLMNLACNSQEHVIGLYAIKTLHTLKKWWIEDRKALDSAVISSSQLRHDHCVCVYIYMYLWPCISYFTTKGDTLIAMKPWRRTQKFYQPTSSKGENIIMGRK